MTTRRRLPVLAADPDALEPPRPAWQWAVLGVILIVLTWLVLTELAAPVSAFIVSQNVGHSSNADELAQRISAAPPAVVARVLVENLALQLVVLAAAAFTGGFVVGKWGPGQPVSTAAFSGAMTATLAVAIVAAGSRVGPVAVVAAAAAVAVPCAAGAAALGAARGGRRKGIL